MSLDGVNGGGSFSDWCDSTFGSLFDPPSPTEGDSLEQIGQPVLGSLETETGRVADNPSPSGLPFTTSLQEGLSAMPGAPLDSMDIRDLTENPIEPPILDNTRATGTRKASGVFADSLPPKRTAACQSKPPIHASLLFPSDNPIAPTENRYNEGRDLILNQDLVDLKNFLEKNGTYHTNFAGSLLHFCISEQWDSGVKLFLDHGAAVVHDDLRVAADHATKKSKILPMLLRGNSDLINHASKDGETLLHFAVKRSKSASVEQLLAAKVNPNLQLKDGYAEPHKAPYHTGDTPLHVALYLIITNRKFSLFVITQLLLAGVKIDISNEDGVTARDLYLDNKEKYSHEVREVFNAFLIKNPKQVLSETPLDLSLQAPMSSTLIREEDLGFLDIGPIMQPPFPTNGSPSSATGSLPTFWDLYFEEQE